MTKYRNDNDTDQKYLTLRACETMQNIKFIVRSFFPTASSHGGETVLFTLEG